MKPSQACADALETTVALFDQQVRRTGLAWNYAKYVSALGAVESVVPLGDVQATLDVGAGAGVYALAMAVLGKSSHAVDTWAEYDPSNPMGPREPLMRRLAENKVAIQILDLMKDPLPYHDGSFDVCFCMDVIEHVPKPKALLDQIWRVTRGGGWLVLETPNAARLANRARIVAGRTVYHRLSDWYHGAAFYGHLREYTIAEVRQMLDWARFQVVSLTTHNAALKGRQSALSQAYCAATWWHCSLRNEMLAIARKLP